MSKNLLNCLHPTWKTGRHTATAAVDVVSAATVGHVLGNVELAADAISERVVAVVAVACWYTSHAALRDRTRVHNQT